MPPKFSRDKNSAEKVALLGDTDSDEDFFLKGPSTASDKVQRVQRQVNEVVGVMQSNIDKVLDRGDKIEDLQAKSEGLADSASDFNTRARRLQKQMWWRHFKMKICIAIIVILIILIIVLSVTIKNKS